MEKAQHLLGLLRDDAPEGSDVETNGSIFFYSPRPNVASPGFNSLQRDSNFNWIAQGRLSRKQALQFTGSGEDTVTLEGKLFPHVFGGLKTLDRLREAGKSGHRFILVRYYVVQDDGGGDEASYNYVQEAIGRYGIRRVRRGETKIGSTGLPSVLEFVLELIDLGDDAGEDGASSEFNFGSRQALQEATGT